MAERAMTEGRERMEQRYADVPRKKVEEPAPLSYEGEMAACRRLARGTRDCNEGKPCVQASPEDMKACGVYLRASGLDGNPFK